MALVVVVVGVQRIVAVNKAALLVAAMDVTQLKAQKQELQIQAAAAVVVLIILLLAQQVVQVLQQLLIGVNYGTTLRIS